MCREERRGLSLQPSSWSWDLGTLLGISGMDHLAFPKLHQGCDLCLLSRSNDEQSFLLTGLKIAAAASPYIKQPGPCASPAPAPWDTQTQTDRQPQGSREGSAALWGLHLHTHSPAALGFHPAVTLSCPSQCHQVSFRGTQLSLGGAGSSGCPWSSSCAFCNKPGG